ncbi:MAG: hypothetical protein IRY98_12385, partial [Alicyclobacillaceae bacterium]|nr:hypothetical protein [Alicyclobacillaceae bacterium]
MEEEREENRRPRIKPMEPVPVAPFRDEAFWFQMKFDGIRLLADGKAGALILYNRRGRDRTAHYPELAALFQ